MQKEPGYILPLCTKCGRPVPPTNDVLTVFRLRGDSCVGKRSCHMDPVRDGLVSCPGGSDLVRDFHGEELRRLLGKMRNLPSGNGE